jgi:uncharacterized protein YgfB (UPF0149 family)
MAIEIPLQGIIQGAVKTGWEETEVLTAIIEVADNLVLAHGSNAELDALLKALKRNLDQNEVSLLARKCNACMCLVLGKSVSDDRLVKGTVVPKELLPDLGLIGVRQTQLDQAVNEAVRHLANIDKDVAYAFPNNIQSLQARLEILNNLIMLKVTDTRERAKFLAIKEEVERLNRERNRISHYFPIACFDNTGEVMMWPRSIFSTMAPKEPAVINRETLSLLSSSLFTAQTWLGFPFPDEDIPGRTSAHPDWLDDQKFPFPERRDALVRRMQK